MQSIIAQCEVITGSPKSSCFSQLSNEENKSNLVKLNNIYNDKIINQNIESESIIKINTKYSSFKTNSIQELISQDITDYLRKESKIDLNAVLLRNVIIRITWPTKKLDDINCMLYENGKYRRICGCRENINQVYVLIELCNRYTNYCNSSKEHLP